MPRTPVLTDTSPDSLARATLANLTSLNRHLRHSPHTEWTDVDGLFRWRTPIPQALYTGVVSAVAPDASASARVGEAVAYFRARETPAFRWWFDPDVPVEAWAPLLEAHGVARCKGIPGMAIDLRELVPTRTPGVEVRVVDGAASRRTWATTFCRGNGYPDAWADAFADTYETFVAGDPMRSFIAYLGGEPVASASILDSDGVAGLYDVATIPEARGRGVGTTITSALFEQAAGAGFRIGVLHASAMGLPLYERLGFRTVCSIESFECSPGRVV